MVACGGGVVPSHQSQTSSALRNGMKCFAGMGWNGKKPNTYYLWVVQRCGGSEVADAFIDLDHNGEECDLYPGNS